MECYGVLWSVWSVMECYGVYGVYEVYEVLWRKKKSTTFKSVCIDHRTTVGVQWGGPYRSQACNRTACCVCASVIALACSWIALHASVTCGQK